MERKALQPFRDACPKPWSGEKHREFNRPELKGQMREAYVLTSEAWTFPTRFTWTVGTQITEGVKARTGIFMPTCLPYNCFCLVSKMALTSFPPQLTVVALRGGCAPTFIESL